MGVCEMTVKRTRLCHWIARPATCVLAIVSIENFSFNICDTYPLELVHCHWFYHFSVRDRIFKGMRIQTVVEIQ